MLEGGSLNHDNVDGWTSGADNVDGWGFLIAEILKIISDHEYIKPQKSKLWKKED